MSVKKETGLMERRVGRGRGQGGRGKRGLVDTLIQVVRTSAS